MPGRDFTFGRDYVIPTPFDPRLIEIIPIAVAKAAAESGIAKTPIQNYDEYREQLKNRIKI
jgi:malate dehydrogenase (oxaloacetate-decarboxylating)(NADP+)